MRTLSADNLAALQNARVRGLVPRQFATITVKDRSTGDPQDFGLWTGDWPVTATVISGTDGSQTSRAYVGGVNLTIGDIPRVSDLTIQTVEVSMSAIAPICQQIVRGYEPRLARVELHSGWLDPDTRQLVAPAELDFIGVVDGAPIDTAAAGGESMITLRVISELIVMLTRTNPRKRSYEAQKLREGDEFGRYSAVVQNWQIHWGEKGPNFMRQLFVNRNLGDMRR